MTTGLTVKSLLFASTFLMSGTAIAAEAPPGASVDTASSGGAGSSARRDDNNPADIIVTARRVEERLQDVPISITVFNQKQLDNRNIVNSQDLTTYTPSLSSNNNFGSVNSTFAIRGFVQDIGTQPSIGVYFADVVAPRGASANTPTGDGAGPGSFFDLQNVQVLKGPQGALFGRNTTCGAILLVPQKPTSTFDGYVEGSYGNYDLKRIQGVLNAPLGENARFRLAVDHEQRDGFLKTTTGIGPSRLGDIDYTAVRASLVIDLTPNLENYTIASYLRSDTKGEVQKVIACNPDPSFANLLGQAACGQLARNAAEGHTGFYDVQTDLATPRTKLTQWQLISTTTWRASDTITIKNIVSYAQLTEDFTSALFGTRFDLADTTLGKLGLFRPGSYVGFAQLGPTPGGHNADQSTFTEEFQVQGNMAKLNWQAGAYAKLSDPLSDAGAQSPTLINCTNVQLFQCTAPAAILGIGSINNNRGRTNFRNYGLYAQGNYSLTDKIKLTGGVRYTWDRARNRTFLPLYSVRGDGSVAFAQCQTEAATTLPCAVNYRTRSQKPTWLVDLDYKPIDDVLLYVKYARGYRAGGITAVAPVSIATFRPEKVDTYEAGAKTQFRGPVKGTFDVAAFYNNFSNQELQANLNPKIPGTAPGATGIINAGKSRIWGIEAEASISPFAGVALNASYAYLNTKIRRVSIVTLPAASLFRIDSTIEAGDPLTFSPRNKVTATASYLLPLDDDIGKVSVGVTLTHTDRQLVNYLRTAPGERLAGRNYLAPRNLLNLNLNWTSIFGKPVDLSAFATNVTGKKYYTIIPGLYNAVGFETASIGEPRMYGFRLRYRFGK